MIDKNTSYEIDKVVSRILKDAGLTDPPVHIEDLLEYLEVHRGFYDLEDPNLLQRFWHKVKINKQKLIKIVKKIKLAAVWLPDEEQILVDSSLPPPKQEWASFHDSVHRILRWHRPFFLGDTAQTLDPDYQVQLDEEANYGASALMFGGKIFTLDALDTLPNWSSIEELKKKYKKSLVTTLRRYVQFSHSIPMAMIVSTPRWLEIPEDQENRCRHYIGSVPYLLEFGHVSSTSIIDSIDDIVQREEVDL